MAAERGEPLANIIFTLFYCKYLVMNCLASCAIAGINESSNWHVMICDRTCPGRQFQTSYKNYAPGKGKKLYTVFLIIKMTYLNIFKNYGAAELTMELIILQYT